jgi:hypothetical protein
VPVCAADDINGTLAHAGETRTCLVLTARLKISIIASGKEDDYLPNNSDCMAFLTDKQVERHRTLRLGAKRQRASRSRSNRTG